MKNYKDKGTREGETESKNPQLPCFIHLLVVIFRPVLQHYLMDYICLSSSFSVCLLSQEAKMRQGNPVILENM